MGEANFTVDISVTENGRKAPKYTIDSDIGGEVSLQDLLAFTKQSLITIAVGALQEEQAKGFDPQPIVVVDGRQNKSVADVNPLGKIQFVSRQQATTILTDTYQAILDRSPVDTGLYKASNLIFLNGKLVANSPETLQSWIAANANFSYQTGDKFIFVNVTPYARKLERYGITSGGTGRRVRKSRDRQRRSGFGVAGKTGLYVLAENGAYFLASRAIQRKYGKNSQITFELISGSVIPDNLKPTGNATQRFRTTFAARGNGETKSSGPYVYPSIQISIQDTGIL